MQARRSQAALSGAHAVVNLQSQSARPPQQQEPVLLVVQGLAASTRGCKQGSNLWQVASCTATDACHAVYFCMQNGCCCTEHAWQLQHT